MKDGNYVFFGSTCFCFIQMIPQEKIVLLWVYELPEFILIELLEQLLKQCMSNILGWEIPSYKVSYLSTSSQWILFQIFYYISRLWLLCIGFFFFQNFQARRWDWTSLSLDRIEFPPMWMGLGFCIKDSLCFLPSEDTAASLLYDGALTR